MNRRHLFRSLLGMACAPLVAVLPRVKPSAVADYDDGTMRLDEPPAKGESISYAHSQHATSVHTFRIVGAHGYLVHADT